MAFVKLNHVFHKKLGFFELQAPGTPFPMFLKKMDSFELQAPGTQFSMFLTKNFCYLVSQIQVCAHFAKMLKRI